MYKKYNFQTIRTQNFCAWCDVYNNKSGFVHECRLELLNPIQLKNGSFLQATTAKCQYYNRTWERFEFESVILKCINELPKKYQEQARQEFESYWTGESAAMDEKLERFKSNFDGLTDKQKEIFQNVTVENKAQFDSVCGVVGMLSLLNELK